MKSTEFLMELFKPGKNWKWEFRGSEEAFASFKIGDVEYLWYARVMRASAPKQWTIGFNQRDSEFDYEKEFGLAGTGNSAEVMSTVVDITRTFLSEYGDKVEEIRFTSAEPSHTKLYARMVKRLLPNWDLHTKMIGGQVGFYLINPRAYELEEAESGTIAATEIVTTLSNAGYTEIGSGAEATVWAKDAGQIIKIIMPESHDITQAAEVFKTFYEFCIQHKDLKCLPRFIPIQGKDYATFTLGGKQYIQISMEQLYPIKKNSFDEGVVGLFSDFASQNYSWEAVNKELGHVYPWEEHNPRTAHAYADAWQNLSMMQGNEQKYKDYQMLYMVTHLLYVTGKINKLGWDLHTANVMQRKDGTLVIIDPWFEKEMGTIG